MFLLVSFFMVKLKVLHVEEKRAHLFVGAIFFILPQSMMLLETGGMKGFVAFFVWMLFAVYLFCILVLKPTTHKHSSPL